MYWVIDEQAALEHNNSAKHYTCKYIHYHFIQHKIYASLIHSVFFPSFIRLPGDQGVSALPFPTVLFLRNGNPLENSFLYGFDHPMTSRHAYHLNLYQVTVSSCTIATRNVEQVPPLRTRNLERALVPRNPKPQEGSWRGCRFDFKS